MEIINAVFKRDNSIDFFENQSSDYWNSLFFRNNRILSRRKLARFIASLICQTNEIENKLKIFAEQKNISLTEREIIETSCKLYDQMLVLINEWKNFHFQNQTDQEYRNQIDPWNLKIFNETHYQNSKLLI